MYMTSKQLYYCGLTVVLPFTTLLGIRASFDNKPRVGFDMFVNTIGTSTIGVITGLTYPISIPIITGYTIYKHRNETSETENNK